MRYNFSKTWCPPEVIPGHAPDKMLDAMRTCWNKRPAKTSESTKRTERCHVLLCHYCSQSLTVMLSHQESSISGVLIHPSHRCSCLFFDVSVFFLVRLQFNLLHRWLPERFRSQESTAGLCQRVPGQFAGACCHHLLDAGQCLQFWWSSFRRFLSMAVDLFCNDGNCLKKNWWWCRSRQTFFRSDRLDGHLNHPYLFGPTRSQLSWTSTCFTIQPVNSNSPTNIHTFIFSHVHICYTYVVMLQLYN